MLIDKKNLTLKIKKSTKNKICYYLDLPKVEREKHYLYKHERLDLSENNQRFSNEFERCILDKTKICKKYCREFELQDEKNTICRNRCQINKKRLCIQIENQKKFSKLLSAKIKKRPWENSQKCITNRYTCYCNKLINKEKDLIKVNRKGLSDGKSLPYQEKIRIKLENSQIFKNSSFKYFIFDNKELYGQFLKTFQIQYKDTLSLTARNLLTSFKNKYIYYAIDDIICLLASRTSEKNKLLAILSFSMLSLHNDFSVNLFDIWIDTIYLNENNKINRFLRSTSSSLTKITSTTITIKLHYYTRIPNKKMIK